MMFKHALLPIVLLLPAAALSCGPAPTWAPTPAPERTWAGTSTAPAVPTARPAPTESPAPTPKAIVPYIPPSPCPTLPAIPDRYDLPDWLADPDAATLMTLASGPAGEYWLSFVHVPTGEEFRLSIAQVRGYFWMPDGGHFGLLAENARSVYLVNTADGRVTRYDIDKRATRFIHVGLPDPLPEPLQWKPAP